MCDQVGGQGSTIGEITEAMTVSDNIIGLVNEFEGIEVTNFSFNIRKQYKSSDSNGNSIRRQHEVDGLADGKKVVVVRANDQALALSEQHGLFIIKTSPPDVKLVNNEGFKPIKIN